MKSIILFICLFFSYFTLATNVPMEEVVFTDETIENLPPLDEMIGVPAEAPEHLGEVDVDNEVNENQEVEAEIQLAHGGRCRRHHGGHGCGGDRHHPRRRGHGHGHGYPGPPVIVVPPVVIFPPVIQPPIPVSNICRSGHVYCYTYGALPVGSFCQCYGIFGLFSFGGIVSSY